MKPKRIAGIVCAAALVAAWLWAAVGLRRTAPVPPGPQTAGTSGGDTVSPVVAEVESQTSRLRARLNAAPAPQKPSRNPFMFASAARPDALRTAENSASTVEAAPAPPAKPVLLLIGIAEDRSAEGVQRTAIISAMGELFLVKQDETLAAGYRVKTIGADAVELIGPDGALIVLALR